MIHYVHPSLSTPVGYWPVRSKEGMKEEEEEWICTVSVKPFISTLSDDHYFFLCWLQRRKKGSRKNKEQERIGAEEREKGGVERNRKSVIK